MDLLNNEYIHIGSNKIYKELWQYIRMDQTYNTVIKPYGGLWCSNKNNNICDWLDYIRIEKTEYYDYIVSKPSCIIKFKDNSKLLKIDNENDLTNLKQSGFIKDLKDNPIIIDKYYYKYTVNILPNYEKISEYYDLLYINPYVDNCFKLYSINTMLCMNPNIIEYYKTIKLDIDNNKILSIGDKKIIDNPNNDFYCYYEYLKDIFKDKNIINYNEYIEYLNKLKTDIINNDKYLYSNLDYNINNINSLELLKSIVNNLYRERYMSKQKILHK